MKLSLTTRIFLGYAVVLFTFGAVSIFSVLELHESKAELELVSQGYLELAKAAAKMESLHASSRASSQRINMDENPAMRQAWVKAMELTFGVQMFLGINAAKERTRALKELAPSGELEFIDKLERWLQKLEQGYGEYSSRFGVAANLARAQEGSPSDPVAMDRALQKMREQEDAITRQIVQLKQLLDDQISTRVKNAALRNRNTHVAIIALSLVAIAVGLIATAVSARSLRPVGTLIEAVSRIGRGDYGAQLRVKGDDEIAQLARAFDGMARSLQEREALLKEKNEALLRAEQLAAVGRVSAQIAHEVRNPLSSIGLNMELLEEAFGKARFGNERESGEARDILASVLREVDRLTEVTEHYLRMARMPKPSLAAEDLNEVLESVLDFSKEELERSRVEVIRRLDPTAPKALADEAQLRQVFLNLLRNSRDAMRERGGKLTIESRGVNGSVEVVFRDTGRGMTPEIQRRIFEPFFSTKDNGTGLGLAVSQQILQAHGGSIDCQSAPGAGTIFIVRLPHA